MKAVNFLLITLTTLFAILISATPSYAANFSNPALQIIATEYEPFPAQPGIYIELTLTVENVGNLEAENVTVELIPEYPFSLDPNEQAVKNFGKILAKQYFLVTYKIRIAEDVVEGWNELKLKVQTCPYCGSVTYPFNIKIETVYAVLAVEQVTSTPAEIPAGESAQLVIKIKNIADSLLRDVSVKLDLANTSVPFAPLNSTSEKRIKFLPAGDSVDAAFDLISLPDAEAGVHKIPLTISYSDELGVNYTKEDVISLIIGGAPELRASLEEADVLKAGVSGDVIINLINKGPTTIKFLTVKALLSENFEILTTDEVYIGSLDPDDTDSVEFKIYVKPGVPSGSMAMPLSLEYRDAQNRQYEQAVNVGLRVYTTAEAQALGLETPSPVGMYALIVVLLILAYLGYKHREKLGPTLGKIGKRISKRKGQIGQFRKRLSTNKKEIRQIRRRVLKRR